MSPQRNMSKMSSLSFIAKIQGTFRNTWEAGFQLQLTTESEGLLNFHSCWLSAGLHQFPCPLTPVNNVKGRRKLGNSPPANTLLCSLKALLSRIAFFPCIAGQLFCVLSTFLCYFFDVGGEMFSQQKSRTDGCEKQAQGLKVKNSQLINVSWQNWQMIYNEYINQ